MEKKSIINESIIQETLQKNLYVEPSRIAQILQKAKEMKGLDIEEVAALTTLNDEQQLHDLFETAARIKETIYGKRIVIFAPLYISNLCKNECLYCAFRAKNRDIERRSLTQQEIAHEVTLLLRQGHKRILMVAGESYSKQGFDYILDSIETIYSVKTENTSIRRVNVNIAPLAIEEFVSLKQANIGTYQLFQETYHRETYSRVHTGGMKKDYTWRITALDRAIQAGIDDTGIGVLFGLFDWKFELLAMMQHIAHLENTFGIGPHTISMPRLEPATGSSLASHPPYAVSDMDFRKIIAIVRLSVPYTGIIMSTRETPQMRRETFALGVSQISAGSRTNPGGYSKGNMEIESSQFCLGDHRDLDMVIRDAAEMGYIPSFCTGCYRLGRTGSDFMELAKPGEIKLHCDPNALSTFQEYLIDFASAETKATGEKLIRETINRLDGIAKQRALKLVKQIRGGKRDVFC